MAGYESLYDQLGRLCICVTVYLSSFSVGPVFLISLKSRSSEMTHRIKHNCNKDDTYSTVMVAIFLSDDSLFARLTINSL